MQRLWAVAAFGCAAAALIVARAGPAAAADSVQLPFAAGQAVRVIQGYNGGTHQGRSRYALDLVLAGGQTSGAAAVSPVAGAVAWAQAPGAGTGCLAIAMREAGYSVVLCHLLLDHAMRSGEAVGAGQVLGTVGPPGTVGNNGTAHVHLELHRGSQGSNPVPFGGSSGLSLAGADLPASGAPNEHMSRMLGASGEAPPAAAPVAAAPAVAPRVAPAAPAPAVTVPAPAAAAPAPPAARQSPGVAQPADPPSQEAATVKRAAAAPTRAAVVEGTGACLKVRDQPGLDGAVVDCVWDGMEVQLGDRVQRSDAMTWRQVPGFGWVADEFLRRTRAVISGTGSCLNVRDTPTTLGAVLTCLPEGTSVVLGESTEGEFGAWIRINNAGWVLNGFLT